MNQQEMAAMAAAVNRPGQILIAREFAIYSTGRLAALVAAATAITNILIEAASDFLIEKTTYTCDVAGAALTVNTEIIPNVTAQMTLTGSGRQLVSVGAPLTGYFGTGRLPFIWPRPYLIPASSTLQISLTSVEAAQADTLTLNFIGQKLYWAKQ